MKCHELEEYLSEHLEGELDKARTDALLDHIETCERCRAEFQAYEGQEKQLHRYFLRERAKAERIANPLEDQFASSPVGRLGKSDGSAGSDRSDNLQSPISSIRNPQRSALSTQHSALIAGCIGPPRPYSAASWAWGAGRSIAGRFRWGARNWQS
jgi:anti-sigma factor RsiW